MVDPGPSDLAETYVRNCTILEEVENHEPTDEEVRMYARAIGIDPDKEADLLYIAREGICAPVPKGWIVLQNRKGGIFYQQKCSGVCIWDHPLDAQFRLRVVEARLKKSKSQGANSGEALPTGSEPTPVKTETIYQALPVPRTRLNASSSEFKVPSVPPRTVSVPNTGLPSPEVDSPSTSTSVRSPSGLNLPHVNLSPTGDSRQRKVLSEINANNITSATKASSQRHHGTDENADPAASVDALANLADRFASAVRVSASSQDQPQRRLYSDSNATRRLFYAPNGDVTSCLFSPPESPQSRPRHQRGGKVRPRATEAAMRPELSASPAERMVVELDGNLSVQYLLEEQKRLHEKIAFLKVTYKAYKLRLANVNASIKMIQSTAAAAAAIASPPTFHTPPSVVNGGGSGFRASPANHSNATANSAPLGPASSRRLTAVNGGQRRERQHRPGNRTQRAHSIQNGVASRTSRSNL
ncbi:unnamed protein product [Taenia asiatica]|uniref:WW domain-containing protein n=1 Tax=Taenia asiatica TaxID=60517 RepID=A0A0R3W6X7_TAEAS|nr:unnamed protein product [Taenia asiatica]